MGPRGGGRSEEERRGPEPAPDDAALVLAARGGDERAFEALLLRHEATVLRVLRLLGVGREDREDVAQEVFLRVFRYLGGFRTGRPFASWLYRITVNTSHDFHGRVRRRRRGETAWDGREAEDASPGPEEERERAALGRRLERALAVLSERERAVFVLRELEGLSTAAVARSLGITGVTVRRHLGRARRHLQRALRLSRSGFSVPDRSSR